MSFIESAGVRGAIVLFSKKFTGLLAATPTVKQVRLELQVASH